MEQTVAGFRLGSVTVDVAGKRLLCDGQRIEADTQQVDLLLALIAAYPELVTKEQLIECVWGGPYVTEAALHKTVSTLRRTLRRHGLEQAIETRHRRGYQLGLTPEPLQQLPQLVAVGVEANPAPSRWHVGTLALLLLAAVIVGGLLWWVPRLDPEASSSSTEHVPAAVVDKDSGIPAKAPDAGRQRERLQGMDDDGLLDTIRRMLFEDPAYAREAVQLLRQRGMQDERGSKAAALAEKYDGILYYRAGEFELARERYLDALARFRSLGDRLEESNVLNNLAVLLSEQGRQLDQAESLYRESLALRESLGEASSVMASHRNLANLLFQMGALDRAEAAVQAYAVAAERLGSVEDRAQATILLGDVLRERGEDPMPRYREAVAQAMADGLPVAAAGAEQRIGDQLMRAADFAGARDAFQHAVTLYEQGDASYQLPWLLYPLGNALEQLGDDAGALREYQRAVSLSEGLSDNALLVDLRIGVARLLSRRGDDEAARGQLDEAWRIAAAIDNPLTTVSVRTEQAMQSLLSGHAVAARGLLASGFAALGDASSWPHEARLRDVSIMTAIAAGDAPRVAQEISELQRLARQREDASTLQRSRTLQGWAALAQGRFAAAYRQLDRASAPARDQSVTAKATEPAKPPIAPAGWLRGLGMLLVGMLVGIFIANAMRS